MFLSFGLLYDFLRHFNNSRLRQTIILLKNKEQGNLPRVRKSGGKIPSTAMLSSARNSIICSSVRFFDICATLEFADLHLRAMYEVSGGRGFNMQLCWLRFCGLANVYLQ